MSAKTKSERHRTILDIVLRKGIGTQEHFKKELERRGIKTTQATLSRDIKTLGLHKIRTAEGKLIYSMGEERPRGADTGKLKRMLADFVEKIDGTNNLVIIKTSPGSAQGVAAAIDGVSFKGVLGTVAGDDTILVITKNSKTGKEVKKTMENL
jgi:transcriptional regulator of arginine metabolism